MSWAEYLYISKYCNNLITPLSGKRKALGISQAKIDEIWVSEENEKFYINVILNEEKGIVNNLRVIAEGGLFAQFERTDALNVFKLDITSKIGRAYDSFSLKCSSIYETGYIFERKSLDLEGLKKLRVAIQGPTKFSTYYICDRDNLIIKKFNAVRIGTNPSPDFNPKKLYASGVAPCQKFLEDFVCVNSSVAHYFLLKNEDGEICGFQKVAPNVDSVVIEETPFCSANITFASTITKFIISTKEGMEIANIDYNPYRMNYIKINKILPDTHLCVEVFQGDKSQKLEHYFTYPDECWAPRIEKI